MVCAVVGAPSTLMLKLKAVPTASGTGVAGVGGVAVVLAGVMLLAKMPLTKVVVALSAAPMSEAGEDLRMSVSWSNENISVVPELGTTRGSLLGSTSPYLLTKSAPPTLSVACCKAGLTCVSPTKK